jgi:hypothetical protein
LLKLLLDVASAKVVDKVERWGAEVEEFNSSPNSYCARNWAMACGPRPFLLEEDVADAVRQGCKALFCNRDCVKYSKGHRDAVARPFKKCG